MVLILRAIKNCQTSSRKKYAASYHLICQASLAPFRAQEGAPHIQQLYIMQSVAPQLQHTHRAECLQCACWWYIAIVQQNACRVVGSMPYPMCIHMSYVEPTQPIHS